MLMTREDVERWLTGTIDEALVLQQPATDAAVVVQKEKVAAPVLREIERGNSI